MTNMKSEPVFKSKLEHADKTQEMLVQQLKDAGKVAILYIPLDKLNAEIGGLMDDLNSGRPYDEGRLDYLLLCLDANPEYKAQKAKELERWRSSVQAFTKECLREMRTFISARIFKHSVASLQTETGYPIGLCKRLLSKKCLWLTRISTEDICRMHVADLLNKFNPLSQGLDIVEIAAIYAQMPPKFLVDPGGKKEKFRESIVQHVKELMAKKEQGKLTKAQTRYVLYESATPCYGQRATLHSLALRASDVSGVNSAGATVNPMMPAVSSPPDEGPSPKERQAVAAGDLGQRPPPAFASSLNELVKKRQSQSYGSGGPALNPMQSRCDDKGGGAQEDGEKRPPVAFASALAEMAKKRQSQSDGDVSSSSTSVTHQDAGAGGARRPPPAFASLLAEKAKKRQTSADDDM